MNYRKLYETGKDRLEKAGIQEAALDARLLLEEVCRTDRNTLLVHGDRAVTEEEETQFRIFIERRSTHEPLQQITGWQEFMGLRFSVTEDVLVPRQDTETLVEEVMRYLRDGMEILDVCTGSGCILLSLLRYSNGCRGVGCDISAKALAVAAQNAKELGISAQFIQSDLFESIEGRFEYIVSNPPFNVDFSDNRDTLAGENYKERFWAGVPKVPNKDKDKMAIYQMFLQHIIYSLKEDGKAAVVVPTGFLTAGTGIPKSIREYIIKEKMLRGVISMPSNIFATTGTNVSILFLDRANKDGKVLLMDASKLGHKEKVDGKNQRTVLEPEEIQDIIGTFINGEEKDDFSVLVDYEQIEQKKLSFSAGQYFEVKIEYVELTPEEFDAKMNDYTVELQNLFAEGNKLQQEILEQLKKVRYDL